MSDEIMLPEEVLKHLAKLPPGAHEQVVVRHVLRKHLALEMLSRCLPPAHPDWPEARRAEVERDRAHWQELALTAPGHLGEA